MPFTTKFPAGRAGGRRRLRRGAVRGVPGERARGSRRGEAPGAGWARGSAGRGAERMLRPRAARERRSPQRVPGATTPRSSLNFEAKKTLQRGGTCSAARQALPAPPAPLTRPRGPAPGCQSRGTVRGVPGGEGPRYEPREARLPAPLLLPAPSANILPAGAASPRPDKGPSAGDAWGGGQLPGNPLPPAPAPRAFRAPARERRLTAVAVVMRMMMMVLRMMVVVRMMVRMLMMVVLRMTVVLRISSRGDCPGPLAPRSSSGLRPLPAGDARAAEGRPSRPCPAPASLPGRPLPPERSRRGAGGAAGTGP